MFAIVGPVTELRWRQADRPQAQGALFDEPVFEREPGRGEFRGMEFLHVRAQRIINEVPGAPFGFRYSINAYRGCSHACTYCLAGETPILMADGSARPLADVRPGDEVCGTVREGAHRRCIPTTVIDHWSTVKPAYQVTLADDTRLVASGDHRFLTDRGWKHVTRTGLGSGPRPHLTRHHSLLGIDEFGGSPGDAVDGPAAAAIAGGSRRRVVGIEPLNAELPLFDITTGTGDFIAGGVVSHNCFARPTHTYLDLDAGRDFERRIVVKVNAASRLRHELDPRRWAGELIAMGTNTDPYQRAEGKYRLTRGIVEALVEHANPFSILTKSTLVLRDLELLAEAARAHRCAGQLVDRHTRRGRVAQPPSPARPTRSGGCAAVEQLNAAGVPAGVLVAPVLPGLSDRRRTGRGGGAGVRRRRRPLHLVGAAPPSPGREGGVPRPPGRVPSPPPGELSPPVPRPRLRRPGPSSRRSRPASASWCGATADFRPSAPTPGTTRATIQRRSAFRRRRRASFGCSEPTRPSRGCGRRRRSRGR